MDFTLSNARRFYSSMGNPLGVKGSRNPVFLQYLNTSNLSFKIGNGVFHVPEKNARDYCLLLALKNAPIMHKR